MSDETQIEKLHELITNVRIDIGKLDTKMDSIKDLSNKVDQVDDTAKEALLSTRSSHKRIDEISDNQKWLWRTAVGGLILGGIGLLWKGLGH